MVRRFAAARRICCGVRPWSPSSAGISSAISGPAARSWVPPSYWMTVTKCSAETVDSVLSRWACDLWGIDGGQTDVDAGFPTTRAWFDSIRAEFAGKRSTRGTTREG